MSSESLNEYKQLSESSSESSSEFLSESKQLVPIEGKEIVVDIAVSTEVHATKHEEGTKDLGNESIKTALLEAAFNVEAGAEDWNDKDSASGRYNGENGEWVEVSGYYDKNGDVVETGGYYDESGKWVEYQGYYNENGEWVDVEVPETGFPEDGTEHVIEHQQTEDACDQYYEDTGGGHGMLG